MSDECRIRVDGQIRFDYGYVWTWKFSNAERRSCGFKNTWILVDGASISSTISVRGHIRPSWANSCDQAVLLPLFFASPSNFALPRKEVKGRMIAARICYGVQANQNSG